MVPPISLPAFDPTITNKLGPEGVARLEIAASVCAPAVAPGKDGALLVGCRSCPPFTAETGPDGTVRIDEKPGRAEFYELEHTTFGSFSAPGVDEVAATFSGCESPSGNHGGTLLARRKGNEKVWVALSYRSGFRPVACRPFTLPDKRDLLLCTWSSTGQRGVTTDLLDSYDFALPENDENAWQHILAVPDDTFGSCTKGMDPGHYVVTGSIDRFSIVPATGVSESIQLEVTFGSAIPGLGFKRMCDEVTEALDQNRPVTTDLRTVFPRKKHRLTVIRDGKGFVLDAASAAAWSAVQPVQPIHP